MHRITARYAVIVALALPAVGASAAQAATPVAVHATNPASYVKGAPINSPDSYIKG